VIIAGPTEAKVPPVPGATLLITYKKGPNEGGEETTPIVTVSPTPGRYFYAKCHSNYHTYSYAHSDE